MFDRVRDVSGGRAEVRRSGGTGWPGVLGKRVLVTGGTRGLGEQIVRLPAAEGAQVATCARTPLGLAALADSLDAPLFTQPLDVTEPERLEAFVTAAAKRFGGLDGVVACTGGSHGGSFVQARVADRAATWEVNVGRTARLLRAAVPHLRAAAGGSVVVISSISG